MDRMGVIIVTKGKSEKKKNEKRAYMTPARRAFVIVASAIAAALVASVVLIDIDQYKPRVEAAVSSIVGNEVRADKLSLYWNGKITLGIKGVKVYVENDTVLYIDKIEAAISAMPLLKREIIISSIIIQRPKIQVLKTVDGKIKVRGISPSSKALDKDNAEQKREASGTPLFKELRVDALQIRDAEVSFRDFTAIPVRNLVIKDLDLSLNRQLLSSDIKISSKMAVLSAEQNVSINGTARWGSKEDLQIREMDIEMDLSSVDPDICLKQLRELREAGVTGGFDGSAAVRIEELSIENGAVSRVVGQFSVSKAMLLYGKRKVRMENIQASGTFGKEEIDLSSFSMEMLNASIKGAAKLRNVSGKTEIQLKTEANVERLKPFISAVTGTPANIDGSFSFLFNGGSSGSDADSITENISGKGMFTLENGVLLNVNILAESFERLSMFPGLVEKVENNLPSSLRRALYDNYTVLKPIQQIFTVKRGVAKFSPLYLSTEYMELEGTADASIRGQFSGDGTIIVSRPLSEAIVNAFSPVSELQDASGMITFPLKFRADIVGGVTVTPDMKYIGSRISAGGQSMMSGLLDTAGNGASGGAGMLGSALKDALQQGR